MFGAVEFFKACRSVDIKPLIGCELYVAPRSRHEKKRVPGERTSYRLTLIAKNAEGYQNLGKLSSIGFTEGFYYNPRIDLEILEKHKKGLICLSGCLSSHLAELALSEDRDAIAAHLLQYQNLFGDDYYFEVQRHSMTEDQLHEDGITDETWLLQKYHSHVDSQAKVEEKLKELSEQFSIKVVATNDSHYMDREDWRAHEILLNVQSGEPVEIWDSGGERAPNPKRHTYPSHEFYFKSAESMQGLFSDFPEAIENTLEVADKCSVEVDFKTKHYPVYIPERDETVEECLFRLCREGIEKRYTPERLALVKEKYPDKDPLQVVHDRLEHEMSIIAPKGMCDYLLIVWDFIHWAKSNNIAVGPGRGSGAGSIVLYLIGITDIEPLHLHLFFERFINPERLSYPDIDVDICMDRRGEVIKYTIERYGKDNVCQIITFGTMKAKMAIRDVGRVLNVPLAKVNTIAKLVPEELGITIQKALEIDPELSSMVEQDEEAGRIIENAKRLEGSIRSTGIHAAGMIISGEPLTDHIPVCTAKDSDMPVSQFSMKPVEQVGMLKVDFLGLKTLTSIEVCCKAVEKRFGTRIDWVNLPLDDEKTFSLLNQGKTLGVFQLESGGMQELARHLHLDRFEEIIAVVALYRPGPMDMIPSFINRKHGTEPIEYDHPWMKDILEETYGIMVYQEQVMAIACKLANYSLGEGDVLRRAMGKKDAEEMARQREKFVQGALDNDISEPLATTIFNKMEKFASYGFNKSHAAAYGFLSYVTAYMKANYPGEWMAALMTCDRHDISKVAKFIGECQEMNIPILPPDANEARADFVATPSGIRFAMAGIKGVGSALVESIVEERDTNGPFKDLYDFLTRTDSKKVGKKGVENLIDAGCFDFTSWTRDALRADLDPMFDTATREQKENASGVMSLFSLMDEEETRWKTPPKVERPTSSLNLLRKEKELLGFFVTGHPMDAYRPILTRLSCVPLQQAIEMDHDAIFRAAFIVETAGTRISSKTQKKFAILQISDGFHRMELPVWPEMYEQNSHLLVEGNLLYAVLQLDRREDSPRISCRWLSDLTTANEETIADCDRAFDRAKNMIRRFNNRPAKSQKKQPEKGKPMQLQITLNADSCHLLDLLAIQDLFGQKEEGCPIELQFLAGQKYVGSVMIDPGIKPSRATDLRKQLLERPEILECKISN